MKKFVMVALAIFLVLECQTDARSQMPYTKKPKANIDFPEVPRVSAYEAYAKFKIGKAIIIQSGGQAYKKRHILGALEISQVAVKKGKIRLPNLPRKGIEIFTYCY